MFFFISVPNFLVVTSGYGDSGWLKETETLSIGNLDPPYYPNHPRLIIRATGGFLHQDFVTCGGEDDDFGTTNKCYMLGSEGPFATMMTKREYATSIVLEPGKLWILGGIDDIGYPLSSTEYIFADGRNEEGPAIPIALEHFAMVKINQSTSFLAGGFDIVSDSERTWFYYKEKHYDGKWLEGPDLEEARSDHSLGIITDSVTGQVYVVASGGWAEDAEDYLNDVEIMDLQKNKWEPGKLL